jgi:hypothetical protein
VALMSMLLGRSGKIKSRNKVAFEVCKLSQVLCNISQDTNAQNSKHNPLEGAPRPQYGR